ncbi:hypothetical protein GALL_449050 [mine drainage metagenome]|uniref:Uncharacterized protein n=1 Tax=mine drainage metagenome TaxID=410659 RepID=A0A1J5PQP1_9ZZZZ
MPPQQAADAHEQFLLNHRLEDIVGDAKIEQFHAARFIIECRHRNDGRIPFFAQVPSYLIDESQAAHRSIEHDVGQHDVVVVLREVLPGLCRRSECVDREPLALQNRRQQHPLARAILDIQHPTFNAAIGVREAPDEGQQLLDIVSMKDFGHAKRQRFGQGILGIVASQQHEWLAGVFRQETYLSAKLGAFHVTEMKTRADEVDILPRDQIQRFLTIAAGQQFTVSFAERSPEQALKGFAVINQENFAGGCFTLELHA